MTANTDKTLQRLPQSGGSRRYYRESRPDGTTCVLTEADDRREMEAFIRLANTLGKAGCRVPQVWDIDFDALTYRQTDLGSTSLLDIIKGDDKQLADRMIVKTLKGLVEIQTTAVSVDDLYPVAEMDVRTNMWDLHYFKYCFLKATGIDFSEPELEDDFERLAQLVLELSPFGFMYRDFQSRNVMVKDDEPWFIDFQGGRHGALLYDAASFLWQSRAGFDDNQRRHYAEVYFNALRDKGLTDERLTFDNLRIYALFRTLQTLGAYGFRGLIEHKPAFVTPIAAGIDNLLTLKDVAERLELSELSAVITRLADSKYARGVEPSTTLRVRVNSFGFRKSGIPFDPTGNGGGHVFDCRALPNPGRLPEFKTLTGRDGAVREWLEQYPEVEDFIKRSCELVDMSVSNYLERGFSDLSASFGCTGGQHRSVYCAERLASYLAERYPCIEIEVAHTEQDITYKKKAQS